MGKRSVRSRDDILAKRSTARELASRRPVVTWFLGAGDRHPLSAYPRDVQEFVEVLVALDQRLQDRGWSFEPGPFQSPDALTWDGPPLGKKVEMVLAGLGEDFEPLSPERWRFVVSVVDHARAEQAVELGSESFWAQVDDIETGAIDRVRSRP